MARDITLEYDRLLIGTPAAGPLGAATFTLPRVGSDFDADIACLRYTGYPADSLAFHFDLGFAGESTGGEQAIVVGGAVRGLLAENGPLRLAAQFDAHFVPETRHFDTGVDPILGPYTGHGEEDTYEYGLSLLGSMAAEWGEAGSLVVYAGPRVSVFRGEFSSYVDLHDTGDRLWISGVAKQDDPLGVVAGAAGRVQPGLVRTPRGTRC